MPTNVEKLTRRYQPPVDQLLEYGLTNTETHAADWPDYLSLEFNQEHIPELIRLVVDNSLSGGDWDSPAAYAPIHAWRTLGLLRAEAATEPLLSLLSDMDSGYVQTELPVVFGLIGPAALPLLKKYLSDSSRNMIARAAVADAIRQIAETYPDESRADGVKILSDQFERLLEDDCDDELGENAELAAFLVDGFVKLKALEVVPLIERLFALERVEETITGSLEDVLVDIGVQEATPEYLAEKQRRETEFEAMWRELQVQNLAQAGLPRFGTSSKAGKTKQKRKTAKASRRKNRR